MDTFNDCTYLAKLNAAAYSFSRISQIKAKQWFCRHLKQAGSAGLVVDPSKIVWTPYNSEREMAAYRN